MTTNPSRICLGFWLRPSPSRRWDQPPAPSDAREFGHDGEPSLAFILVGLRLAQPIPASIARDGTCRCGNRPHQILQLWAPRSTRDWKTSSSMHCTLAVRVGLALTAGLVGPSCDLARLTPSHPDHENPRGRTSPAGMVDEPTVSLVIILMILRVRGLDDYPRSLPTA